MIYEGDIVIYESGKYRVTYMWSFSSMSDIYYDLEELELNEFGFRKQALSVKRSEMDLLSDIRDEKLNILLDDRLWKIFREL